MFVKCDLKKLVTCYILMVRLKDCIFDFEVPIQNKPNIQVMTDAAI